MVTQNKTLWHYNIIHCWQVRPAIWNVPANSKGGLESVADLSKVCALVTIFGHKNIAVVPHPS
jgi:hypothetical protein